MKTRATVDEGENICVGGVGGGHYALKVWTFLGDELEDTFLGMTVSES